MANTRDNLFIFEQGFDGFNHLFKRVNFLKTNNKFVEWANDNRLKGNGTSDNPFIINSSVELPENTFLSNLDVYVLIKSREFNILDLKKCKNFTLKDCKFTKLTLLKCFNLTIHNSDTNILNVLKSKDLEIKNCEISTSFDYYSKRIKYIENNIKLDYFKRKDAYPDKWVLYIVGLTTVMIVFLGSLAIFLPSAIQPLLFGAVTILAFVLVYLIIKKTIIGTELRKFQKKKK